MTEDKVPAKRRRLGAQGMVFRRRRIFASLRGGFTYEEIAAEEGVSSSRIRQIVSRELEQRAVDSGAEHAKLQLERLAAAMQVAAEAIAAGDVSAIPSYLKVLDRLDRYQTVACANQAYDDEARKKLMDRVNRIAENLGIDADFEAAVRARLQEVGEIPADDPAQAQVENEAEAEGEGAHGSPGFMGEANAPVGFPAGGEPGAGFFYPNWP